jgi:hypothetical protein
MNANKKKIILNALLLKKFELKKTLEKRVNSENHKEMLDIVQVIDEIFHDNFE